MSQKTKKQEKSKKEPQIDGENPSIEPDEILPPEQEAVPPSAKTPRKTSSKDVVPYDPQQAYMRELKAHPPITREEEHELAILYKEKGDLDAAYKLVVSNLRLVMMIARQYQKAARSLMDLVQEGNIGLMEAVKNFDPYKGTRFPSYAVYWVRAYIIRYIIANWRMVKIGTTQAQRKLFFNLHKEREKLEQEGFYPAPKLLAARLDVKESEVIEMQQRLSGSDLSVDAPLGSDGDEGGSMHSFLPTPELSPEELIGENQVQKRMIEAFSEFKDCLLYTSPSPRD